jgi:hypothetical protein
MTVNNSSENDASNVAQPSLETINSEIAQAQLQKLNLEIENLRAGTDWESRITRSIPLLTAVVSILGFLWGIHVFNQQQELDRVTRETDRISRDQAQYRASYEQLLQYSSNPNMTLAQALFLRQSINSLIDSLYPPDKNTEANKKEKERLQEAIVDVINRDCDFTQARQVRFDMLALEKWGEYQSPLEATSRNTVIVGKYLQALRDLQNKDPNYLKSLRAIQYDEYPEELPLSEPYRSLIEGFGCHVSRLAPEQRAKAIDGFRKATDNPVLTADLFAESRALCQQ